MTDTLVGDIALKASEHEFYHTWANMRQRCNNPNTKGYENYGGRGITVCERWLSHPDGFWQFVADMGPKPTPKHTLERRENELGYSPENCRWATRQEQLLNTRRTHAIIDPDGASHTTIELSQTYGISPALLAFRHNQGKPWNEIISTHHLVPGYVNIVDAIAKSAALNRARTHCRHGHELTPENTIVNGNNRACKECAKVRRRAHYHRVNPEARNYRPRD